MGSQRPRQACASPTAPAGPAHQGATQPSRNAAGMGDLPAEIISHIARMGFTSHLSPLYDRGDLLEQACTLACVGNQGCTALARELFAALSPRLGQQLPGGITLNSSIAVLKAGLKQWGLAVSGNKGQLHQRLLDEVQDSEADEQGRRPQHCLVSGATRRELMGGVRSRRISQTKAKDTFKLLQYQLDRSGIPSRLDLPSRGGQGLPTVRTFLLNDIKRVAVQLHGSWEGVLQAKQAAKDREAQWLREREQRIADVRAELARRGRSLAEVEEHLEGEYVYNLAWPSHREDEPLGPAVDWLERVVWAESGQWQQVFAYTLEFGDWQPPASLSYHRAQEARWQRAADAAVEACVADAKDLDSLRGEAAGIPGSLLPEMEGMWQRKQEKEQRRTADVRAELALRGSNEAEIESHLDTCFFESLLRGSRKDEPLVPAVDWLEHMIWATSGPQEEARYQYLNDDTFEPPAGMSQFEVNEARWQRAVDKIVDGAVRYAPSLDRLRQDASIPASLLREMEAMWQGMHEEAE